MKYYESCLEAKCPWYYTRSNENENIINNTNNNNNSNSRGSRSAANTNNNSNTNNNNPNTTINIYKQLYICGSDVSINYPGLLEGALETTYEVIDQLKVLLLPSNDERNFIKVKKNRL